MATEKSVLAWVDEQTDAETMRRVFDHVRERLMAVRDIEGRRKSLEFAINQQVRFESRKHGRIEGHIVKLNPKKAKVLVDDRVEWTVPYSMLEAV